MSALPMTFTLPHFATDKSSVSRKKRAGHRAAHRSGTHAGIRASATGLERLGMDFPSLYRTYRRRVYSLCFCMLHNYQDAEDAAQEVFLQLFRKVHTFRGESSFTTWLHRLTTNCVLMEIRRNRRRSSLEVTPREAALGASIENDVLDPSLDSFQARSANIFDQVSIGTALSHLPLGYRRIFVLHDVEGYTHPEIANRLGIQTGTSKSQLHKARIRMRLFLQSGRRSQGEVDRRSCPAPYPLE